MGIKELTIVGSKFELLEMDSQISKFDITITALEENEEICFQFEYCTQLYFKETIEKLMK